MVAFASSFARPTQSACRGLWAALLVSTLAAGSVMAQSQPAEAPAASSQPMDPSMQVPVQAKGVEVEERVGETLPMDVGFTDAEGKVVHLGEYFQGDKPAIVALVYYKCPVTCTVVMSRLAETMNNLDYTVGKDYRTLIFSVDPTEDTKLARTTKLGYISGYNRDVTPEVEAGWQFHVTDDSAARRLADSLGIQFRKLDTGSYSHPVVLAIVTPDGKISRYLYGFAYPPRDVKLALMEASQGKLVKTIGERLLLRCYMYDPKAGTYTLQATRVMQIAGVLTVVALTTLIGGLFISERLRRNRAHRIAAAGAPSQSAQDLSPNLTGGNVQ